MVETLKAAAIGVDEASDAIRDYLDKLEADPKRLEDVESRLALIERLKRKYGSSAGRSAGISGRRSARRWTRIETAGERKAKLEQELARDERGVSRSGGGA